METEQLEMNLGSEFEPSKKKKRKRSVSKRKNPKLKPISLPDTKLDLMEQFAFALQNRDRIGLNQLLAEKYTNKAWGTKQDFINKFLNYCNQAEQKHGSVYVNTVPGECTRETCQFGCSGLGVTVSTVVNNNLLWSFNLVARQLPNFTLALWKCKQFGVRSEQI